MSDTARLALITPLVIDPAAFRPVLEAAVGNVSIASVHLRLALADDDAAKRAIAMLGPVVQDKGVALIIDPPSDLREVARWGADGVHIGDPKGLEEALQALKPDRIVGAGGLRSKDAAMTAGEDGCDYVLFGEPRADGTIPPPEQVADRCQWWAEVFTTPGMGYAADFSMVKALSATGIDFVALGAWAFEGTPAEVAACVKAAASSVHPPAA